MKDKILDIKEKLFNMESKKKLLIFTIVLFLMELVLRIWQTIKQLNLIKIKTDSSVDTLIEIILIVFHLVVITLLVLIVLNIYRRHKIKKEKENIVVASVLITTTMILEITFLSMLWFMLAPQYANIKDALILSMLIISWITLLPYLGIVSYYAWKYTHHNKTKPQVSQTLE